MLRLHKVTLLRNQRKVPLLPAQSRHPASLFPSPAQSTTGTIPSLPPLVLYRDLPQELEYLSHETSQFCSAYNRITDSSSPRWVGIDEFTLFSGTHEVGVLRKLTPGVEGCSNGLYSRASPLPSGDGLFSSGADHPQVGPCSQLPHHSPWPLPPVMGGVMPALEQASLGSSGHTSLTPYCVRENTCSPRTGAGTPLVNQTLGLE